jgi:single-strand DNA-binding protein
MSKDLNKVQLIGRLGADPDIHYTNEGTARTTFRIAVNRQWKDADGQMQQETDWFGIVGWQWLAEIAGEYLHKGSRVYVEGRLKTSSWLDDSGQRQNRTEIALDELIMLDPRPREHDQAETATEDVGAGHVEDVPATPDPEPVPEPTPTPPRAQRRKRMTKAELAAASADFL